MMTRQTLDSAADLVTKLVYNTSASLAKVTASKLKLLAEGSFMANIELKGTTPAFFPQFL